MKWKRGKRSALVEDRRSGAEKQSSADQHRTSRRRRRRRSGGSGESGGAKRRGKGSVLVTVVVVVVALGFYALSGGDDKDRSKGKARKGRVSSSDKSSASGKARKDGTVVNDDELVAFVSFLIEDVNALWSDTFKRELKTRYRPVKLVLFEGSTRTGCGKRRARSGPCYCPADQKMYVPPSFYRDMREDMGASGDFAQALVIAHEMGHHAQLGMGVTAEVHANKKKDRARAREWSVRQELQADCFAGIWAHSTKKRELLEKGDLEEALTALIAIGDDEVQKRAGVEVDSTRWSHGSAAQRKRWFKKGYASGRLSACDSLSAKSL